MRARGGPHRQRSSFSFFPEARSAIRDRRGTHRLPDGFVGPGSPPRFCGAAAGKNMFGYAAAALWRRDRKTQPIPAVRHFPSPLGEGGRRPDEGDSFCFHRDLPLTLALSPGRGKAPPSRKSRKLILPPPELWDTALGFRDGRHELSHLCPETSGACPRLGSDIPMLRQGVRPGRGALDDRPHLPDALESGARASGKTPQAGCRGHHGHRRPAARTPRCPPASRFLPPPAQSRAEPDAHACTHHGRQSAARLRPPSCQERPDPDSHMPGFRVG